MKRIYYALFGWVLMLCGGCDTIPQGIIDILGWHPNEYYCETYIDRYYVIDASDSPIIEQFYVNKALVELPVDIYACRDENVDRSEAELSQLKERYAQLSEQYGDVAFDTWCSIGFSDANGGSWAFPFTEFAIVSNQDFDPLHPAGTPLNDIVEIEFVTHKPFIENGYQHTDPKRYDDDYSGDIVVKLVSELTADDAIFMEPTPYVLIFKSLPTSNLTHQISITIGFVGLDAYKFDYMHNFTKN